VAVAVAARPYPGETVSGDASQVDWHGSICRIALIDGLGHGSQAAAAALAAVTALAAEPALNPVEAVHCCHGALAGTRGAALLVASIDVARGQLIVAGAGNVEARLCQEGGAKHLMTDRGIVGSVLPRVRPVEMALAAEWLLLMYTDGIKRRFDAQPLLETAPGGEGLAQAILKEWARATDDATVLVAQPD
ncbi:MAG: serine/threonine protein kinase, partial [Thermomicrobiales bacterium]|nr:serine/threonine protein kinase [Thermomicrobiales bacterium]